MLKVRRISMLLALALFTSASVFAQVSISISANIAPPAFPVYTQPVCPSDGYLWTPGYWAYDPSDGYYWVPGVWVMPPQYGYLWTPCYWGYEGGIYGFHRGYWGSHVGFYGGVNYGYGYGGVGYGGGEWQGHSFRYNTAVSNVNVNIVHNTYVNNTVINRTPGGASFNGRGGVTARPSPQEQAAMREPHVQPTTQQASHQQTASQDRNQFASVNHGKPATLAMNKVGGQRFNATGRPAPVSRSQPAQQRLGAANNNARNQQAHPQPQAAHQPPPARTQPQQNHSQPQQRQQPQQNRPQPPQQRPQPQQSRPQPQQQRPQPQQNHPQPQQARPQPQEHQAPEGGGGHEHRNFL